MCSRALYTYRNECTCRTGSNCTHCAPAAGMLLVSLVIEYRLFSYALHNNVNCNFSLPVSHSLISISEEEYVVLVVTDSHVLRVLRVSYRTQNKIFCHCCRLADISFPRLSLQSRERSWGSSFSVCFDLWKIIIIGGGVK
jgi:hypothetical protein